MAYHRRVPRAVVIAIMLLGCRDSKIEELRSVRAEVCKCESVACGEDAMRRVPKYDPNHRTQEIANEMLACMAKLYLKDRPSTDPDQQAPATSPGSADPASAGTP
jgi:hypothetical protein